MFISSIPDTNLLLKRHYLLLLILLCALISRSQIVIQNYQQPYYQNFNTLATSGVYNTTLPDGWFFFETGGNAYYSPNNGSNSAGNTYSYGNTGDTERALGSVRSGSIASRYGACIINNTGGTITRFTIEYAGEQWSLGWMGRHDSLDFQYSTNATSLNTGTWVDFNALDFIGPVNSGTTGAINGNQYENRVLISAVVDGLSLATGQALWIRWVDAPAEMTDDGLAVDDFSIIASDPCPVTLESFSPSSGPIGTVVTLSGSNFGEVTAVLFSGVPAESFELISDTVIKVVVPQGAVTGRISCITGCAAISEFDFILLYTNCEISSGIIISELCDPLNGFETDRFIEIFNPTSVPISLDGWSVRAIPNNTVDSECNDYVMCWNLSGEITPGQALTCGYSNAIGVVHNFIDPEWKTESTINGACYLWNGQWRDGAALYDNFNNRTDAILREQSSEDWYSNRSLCRSSEICTPNPNSSYLEWVITDTVYSADLHPSTPQFHNSECSLDSLPIITQHPLSQESCEGSFVEFQLLATGGMEPLIYRWFALINGDWMNLTDQPGFSGADTSILTITTITTSMDGSQYYCKIFNNDGYCYISSNAAHLYISDNVGPATNTIWHQ